MKKTLSFMAGSLLLVAWSCNQPKSGSPAPQEAAIAVPVSIDEGLSEEDLIKKGEYLVTIMGCGDCHTPKKMTAQGPAPDMDRMLSGYDASQPLPDYDKNIAKGGQWVLFNGQTTAAAGPWGVSFSANLTPDATGIGNWKFENFKKALKEGKFKGMDNTRPLLPPMPWQNFGSITDQDLQAIFAFLKSIPPIKNQVPNAMPPS